MCAVMATLVSQQPAIDDDGASRGVYCGLTIYTRAQNIFGACNCRWDYTGERSVRLLASKHVTAALAQPRIITECSVPGSNLCLQCSTPLFEPCTLAYADRTNCT
jgi:hypothetical protein